MPGSAPLRSAGNALVSGPDGEKSLGVRAFHRIPAIGLMSQTCHQQRTKRKNSLRRTGSDRMLGLNTNGPLLR